jgi:NAD(P)H-nitrite reductase large subunit
MKALKKITDSLKEKYDYVGIRFNDVLDTIDTKSFVWDDGIRTNDQLDGLCSLSIDLYLEGIVKNIYCNKIAMLVCGEFASRGEDKGELIIDPIEIIDVTNILLG